MINCDNITTVAKVDLDPEGVGSLDMDTPAVTDRTLRHSLDIILLNPFEKAALFRPDGMCRCESPKPIQSKMPVVDALM